MSRSHQIAILSDIHYAGAAEQARGNDFEFRGLKNPLLRLAVRMHRRFVWLRNPLNQNHLLDEFIRRAGSPDMVVANGDYSCNSAFIGLSDDAAFESARECLGKLRERFGPNFQASIGDHELGKISFVGGRGGMRLASWRRATRDLGLPPLWRVELGNYILMGVASSIVALPVFEADTLAEERAEWREIRERHLAEIRETFAALKPAQRVLLFCHDPTALPFLWREEAVRGKIQQIEQTIIGHLHSPLVLWQGRLMAGMPPVNFLGHTAKRLSAALREARHWQPFKLRLCPSLAGIELLKDGGYYTAELDEEARKPAKFEFHGLKR
ncbi:MAG TPA: metallophosphoesterase [Verrucomicrobiae bacterium]|nr:metallophosphoesterase [Verrucomicrobiae bacterium]